jgi:peptidoglycan/LPS O-acetylase OafA/YrhL
MLGWIITKISILQSGSRLVILVRYVLYWILSITIATLLYKFIEMPFMAMRDRMKNVNLKKIE